MSRRLLAAFLALVVSSVCSRAHAADARSAFEEGVSWLHSFEYERALAAFEEVERLDPRFAMAYWGQAMCYQQFLWGHENLEEARAILTRLRRVPGALEHASARDRAWIASLDLLFGSGGRQERLRAYAAAMAKVAAEDPEDPDAAALQGLALLATASRGLTGSHHGEAEEQEQPQLAGSGVQDEAAQIFQRVLTKHPRHPGALHYLIHAWDDPSHAEHALDAARVYATVAPESSHARHMPAHIFVQLGMWRDAAASDELSFRASDTWVTRNQLPIGLRDYHSLSWLTYEYLQQGRFHDAEETLLPIRDAIAQTGEPRLQTVLATMQARIALEGARWHQAQGPDYRNVDELFAIGMGAAQRGAFDIAERARSRLADSAGQDRYRARRNALQVMEREIAAVIHLRQGRADDAIASMREALAFDARLPPPAGPPQPPKPAAELFGEILLELGRPDEAAAQFESTQRRWPNRAASVLGRARAAAATGDTAAAQSHARVFLDNWKAADPDRAELAEARLLAEGRSTRDGTIPWALYGVGGVSALLVMALARIRARSRSRAQSVQRDKKTSAPRRSPR